jgi:hypothetical protein
MLDFLRDAPLGMLLNRATNDKFIPHREYDLNFTWTPRAANKSCVEKTFPTQSSACSTGAVETPDSFEKLGRADNGTADLDQVNKSLNPFETVEWYDDNDPDDP